MHSYTHTHVSFLDFTLLHSLVALAITVALSHTYIYTYIHISTLSFTYSLVKVILN